MFYYNGVISGLICISATNKGARKKAKQRVSKLKVAVVVDPTTLSCNSASCLVHPSN